MVIGGFLTKICFWIGAYTVMKDVIEPLVTFLVGNNKPKN